MKPTGTLIKAGKISLKFEGRSVLHDVSLQISSGEIVSLIGPNGAGKTSLVKILLGLIKPDYGEVWASPGLVAAYLPQKLFLQPTMPLTVDRFLQLSAVHADKSIEQALQEAGIAGLRYAAMQSVSGGELQRVMLARCLLRNPQLLVLDEPDQGMDAAGQHLLFELIGEIRDRYQCGILVVSHDLHLVMAATDKVICLNHHVCCTGHPESIAKHPEFIQLFGTPEHGLAFYSHEHDHEHDLHGDVIDD